MTKSQYDLLSAEAQELFINSGEELQSDNTLSAPIVGVSLNNDNTYDNCTHTTAPVTFPSDSSKTVVHGKQEQKGPSAEVNESSNDATISVDSPPVPSLYTDGFDILDPVELLIMLDDNVASGKVELHPWQMQALLDFAQNGISDKKPFQSVMRACNGSGKDKYIIAPCAVWLNMRYKRARCVVTSSSGVQLDNQTCAYIDQLCEAANRKFGKVWKLNYRYYECLATQSPIICYATDEAGKAEGFHPLDYDAKMAIFVSEDKTVPDEINVALNKCTGYTHRFHVSTPGNAFGHFFDLCSSAISRASIKTFAEIRPEDWVEYHVRASDCPHLSESYIKQMKRDLPGGEFGAAYKSQVEAEFGTTDEMVVVPYTYIWKAKKIPIDKWIQEKYNKAGLDLSDGGDETVLVIRNGNRMLRIVPFKFDNTEDTVAFLNEKFRENELTSPEALIFADCGGIGKPILDRMKRQGWSNIRYCDNRAKTLRPKTYKNWGAESWFHFGDLLKKGELLILDDAVLTKQLATRYYKILDGAIHQLLSKIEMRSRGYPSPDRADACVLAFSDYKSTFVETNSEETKPFKVEEKAPPIDKVFSLKAWAFKKEYNLGRYRVNNGQQNFDDLQDEVANYNKQLISK